MINYLDSNYLFTKYRQFILLTRQIYLSDTYLWYHLWCLFLLFSLEKTFPKFVKLDFPQLFSCDREKTKFQERKTHENEKVLVNCAKRELSTTRERTRLDE